MPVDPIGNLLAVDLSDIPHSSRSDIPTSTIDIPLSSTSTHIPPSTSIFVTFCISYGTDVSDDFVACSYDG